MTNVVSLPKKLVEGYREFRANDWKGERTRYEELAELGQHPEVMIVACCDSRAAPEIIFNAVPGEFFVIRNVANLVPPFEPDKEFHGTSAALEYGVKALKIKHIVLMGHARCSGIAAFRNKLVGSDPAEVSNLGFIDKWMSILTPLSNDTEKLRAMTPDELQTYFEQAAIRQSIENLKTFSWINDGLANESIRIHGVWFDIHSGELWHLQNDTDMFERFE